MTTHDPATGAAEDNYFYLKDARGNVVALATPAGGVVERYIYDACGTPTVCNTDQGSQFTSAEFTGALLARDVRISMNGRGRALDNVFIERLWRTVKYEEIYLREYHDGHALHDGLSRYFHFYNHERSHDRLGKQTPARVYASG